MLVSIAAIVHLHLRADSMQAAEGGMLRGSKGRKQLAYGAKCIPLKCRSRSSSHGRLT